jgi:hypothetical protein
MAMGKGSLLEKLGLKRPTPLTLDEFRDRVIAEAQKGNSGVELVGDGLVIRRGADVTPVDRGYAYYLDYPSALDAVVRQLAESVLYVPAPAEAENLMVLVRRASFERREDGSPYGGLVRPVAPGLICVVANYLPDRSLFPTAETLRSEIGLSDGALWDRAFANLRSRIELTPKRLEPGRVVTVEHELAASLLAIDEFWADPNLAAVGDLVVLPLQRDEIIITGSSETENIALMRRLGAEMRGATYLSDGLLLRRDGRWEEFE